MAYAETSAPLPVPGTDPTDIGSLKNLNQWADIFFGLLVAPNRTILILTDDVALGADWRTVSGAMITVLLAHAVAAAQEICAGKSVSLPILISVEFQALVMWLALSAILHIVCGWISKRDLSLSNSLVSVGWAFMPLIFCGPVSCFRSLGFAYNFLAPIPYLWMIFLQWLVFNHALRIDSVRMFALLVLGPPLFLITYFFWLFVAVISVAQLFV